MNRSEPKKFKKDTLKPENLLEFEHLISELSSLFVNIPANKVDISINNGLYRIAEYLGLKSIDLIELTEDKKHLRITHSYLSEVIKVLEDTELPIDVKQAFPNYANKLIKGEIIYYSKLPNNLPKNATEEREYVERVGLKSLLSIPLKVGGKYLGAISFNSFNEYRTWPEEVIRSLKQIGEIFANAIARKRSEQKLKFAFKKIKTLKERVEVENFFLKQEIELSHHFDEIIGNSKAIKEVLKKVEQVACTDSTVLILGETGTGKELIARAVHKASKRHKNTMINLNCTAIPSTLMESELFGHEKGSFTGAYEMRMGLFEVADGSTIFLDEIGNLATDLQVKLLRVLQENEVQRVGSTKPINLDIRVLAASNFDLESEVSDGNFREDLFYRINVFPITVPPLRERKEDIPLLIWKFIDEFNDRMNKKIDKIPKRLLKTLIEHPWPGNIRELRNIVERAMIISNDRILRVDVPTFKKKQKFDITNLDEINIQHISQILELTNWKVSGKNGAAELLGIKPTTLEARMLRLGIKRPSV